MIRIFGIVFKCSHGQHYFIPFTLMRLRLVTVPEPTQAVEMGVIDGGEGPEAEDEIVETPTETGTLFTPQRPFSVMRADGQIH